jgi:hypothetical protein
MESCPAEIRDPRNALCFKGYRRPHRRGIRVARDPRVSSSRSVSLSLVASIAALAALSVGCQSRGDLWSRHALTQAPAQATPPQTAAPAPMPTNAVAAPVQAAPVGEQVLDSRPVAPPPPSAAPILTTKNLKTSSVRTISDEKLPKWVPVRGRLSVVGSSDLAENLGLVPKGATKQTDERISVAEKLSEENAARADGVRTDRDSTSRGSAWGYSPGRVRNHR